MLKSPCFSPLVNSRSNAFFNIKSLLLVALLLFPASVLAALSASVTLVSGDPTAIYPSESTRLEITLSNSNTGADVTAAAFNLTLPGTLPNGLKVSGASTYQCTDPSIPVTNPGAGSLTATVDGQTIVLAGGVVPARAMSTDGTCVIEVPVTAGTSTGSSTTYAFNIADNAVTGNDGGAVTNSGQVSQSININALAKPSIDKSFSSRDHYLGGTSRTLTITVTNTNPVAISGFNITDAFPQLSATAIIEVAATPAKTASCNNGGGAPTFNPLAGDTTLTATGDIPAAGGSNGICTLTVKTEAKHTDGDFQTAILSNSIDKSTDFTNDLGIPAASNATANVRAISPLLVSKSFSGNSLSDGETGTFTITLTNNGDAPLTINTFDDNPVDGLGADPAHGLAVTGVPATTCAGGVVTAIDFGNGVNHGVDVTGGVIPANGACTITVDVIGTVETAEVPISYTNTLVEGLIDVGNAAIISQSASASILVADDMRILKTVSSGDIGPGNPIAYTLTIENYSNAAINNVAIDDTLPANMTFLDGIINGNDFSPSMTGTAGCAGITVNSVVGDSNADLEIATVPARVSISSPASCALTFWVMTDPNAADASSTQNTLAIGDICYNAGGTCNGSSATSSASTKIDSAVGSATLRFNGVTNESLDEGTIATLTLTITNISANTLTNVSISDTFPIDGTGQLEIANPANASSNCGTPTITATPGANSFTVNGATVPARANNGIGSNGTCTVTIDVVGPAGTYPDTAQLAGTQTRANGTTTPLSAFNTDTATLTYISALSGSKTFTPSAVSSGGISTVKVRLDNSSALPLTNISITDPLPAGMVLATPVNAYTTCGGAPVFTSATAGDNTITMTTASLGGSGSCDVVFNVVATGGGNWVNTIPVGNVVADGGVRNVAAIAGTLTNTPSTNLSVAKATNPSTLTFPGQTSVLTITITNGADAVTNLAVTDYFTTDGTIGGGANGMAVAATAGASTTCIGGIVSAPAGATQVGLSGVSLAGAAACTVTLNVTSNAIGGVTNFIPVGAISNDQGLTNSGQASTSLTTQSNIGITKNFSPNVVEPGDRSRLRITFYNPTSQAVTGLSVTDNLPGGVVVPSGANPTTTCIGATVTSPVNTQVDIASGSIAAAVGATAASCYAEIDVVVAVEGDYLNTIAASAVTATAGGIGVTNSQPTSDTLFAKSPLEVHKAIDAQTLDAGNPVGFTTGSASTPPGTAKTLTIRFDNANALALTGAALTDTLPSGLVVAQTPNAATTCAGGFISALASATSIRLSGATIPATGSCTLSVDVMSNISDSYTNTIAASAITTNEGVTNDESSSAELVVSTPPSVDKQFSPAVIPVSGTSTLTIVFGNDNASAITLSSIFTDILPTSPGNIVVAGTPNIGGDCPGGVTAVAAAGTVSYANGASIPAGGCSITVDVTGATTGDHNNNIPAGDLQTNAGDNQTPANSSLLISTEGFIAGRIFNDNNVAPNGSYELGTDTPISGVTIELRTGASCGGGLAASVSSDTQGNYLFALLAAGTYSVCQPAQPANTTNGTTTAGAITSANGSTGTIGTATNPTASTSQVVNIILNGDGGAGEISGSMGNDFAEVVPSSISGVVFSDANNNGIKNGADAGLAGVTIELLDNVAAFVSNTTTDANGAYSFTGLDPDTYSVRQPNQPTNTSNGITTAGTVANGGTAGTASGLNTLPSVIGTIILPPNTATSANNFAEIPHGARISGQMYLDYDNSGTLDGSDHGIDGETLNLTGTDINGNAITPIAVLTASDGTYSFTNLPPGTYTISQPAQPTGTTNGATSVGSGGGAATNVATTPSAISGIVMATITSVSGDNKFAEQAGVTPDLTVSKSHWPSNFGESTTSGVYTITPGNIGTGNSSGAMTVVDTLPAGMTPNSVDNNSAWSCGIAGQVVTCSGSEIILAGGSGTPIRLNVSVAGGTSGQVLVNNVTIAGGSEPSGLDGNNGDDDPTLIVDPSSISGVVFLDADNDGVQNGGEPGLGSVQLQLLDNSGNVVASMTTNGAGAYSFTNLGDGTYSVRQPSQPVNSRNGITTAGAVGNGGTAGTATNVATTPSVISGIILPINTDTSANDFAEIYVPPPPATVDLTISKSHWPSNFGEGSQGVYTLTLGNIGNADSRGEIIVVDTLPAGLTALSVDNSTDWNCVIAAQIVTCTGNGVVSVTGIDTASDIRLNVSVDAGISSQELINNVVVSGGNELLGSQSNNTAVDPTAIVTASSISGVVFRDEDNDGLQNGADVGLANVTIELLGDINTVIASTSTDSNGSYSFSALGSGPYSVRQPDQPADTANGVTTAGTSGTASGPATSPSVISNIILLPGTAATGNNFAEIIKGAHVNGAVFFDYNNDGLLNDNDHGLINQSIELTGTDINGNTVTMTTTTGEDGSYSFVGLARGSYTVTQPNQLTGTSNGITTPGTNGGTATPVTTSPSVITGIDLSASSELISNGNNFAEQVGNVVDLKLLKTHLPATLNVESTTGVYTLLASNIGNIDTSGTLTLVDTLPVGITAIAVAENSDWSCAIAEQLVTCTSSAVIEAGGSSGAININVAVASGLSGQTLINSAVVNGGGEPPGFAGNNNDEDPTPISDPAGISGTVFMDENNNGLKDDADSGLAGISIELLDTDDVIIATTRTTADGNYQFNNLAPGTYSIRQPIQPLDTANGITIAGIVGSGGSAGTATSITEVPSAITGIVLAAGINSSENNFAEIHHNGSVHGQVFLDYDNSGSSNGNDHGLSGQIIELTGIDVFGNTLTLEAASVADGSFSFIELPLGTYTLTQPTQPEGTSNGLTSVGSGGGVATDVATTPSSVSVIVLSDTRNTAEANLFSELPGDVSDLSLTKSHHPETFGEGSTTGIYSIAFTNNGTIGTSADLTVVDTLPVGMTALEVLSNPDWRCTIIGQIVTCDSSVVIAAGENAAPIELRVAVEDGLAGQTLVNNAVITGGGEPPGFEGDDSDDDPTLIVEAAQVSGTVWRDINHDRVRDAGEALIANWNVELLLNGRTIRTTTTASDGTYAFTAISPGSGYQIVFRDPESGAILGIPVPNEHAGNYIVGTIDSNNNPAGADNSSGFLDKMTLFPGDNVIEQSLPLDPSGIIYNSNTRDPLSGAEITLGGPAGFDPSTQLVGGINNVTQTTQEEGFYEFLLINDAPSGVYTLTVVEPAGYLPGGSQMIPVCVNTPVVAALPDPALVQTSNIAPVESTALHDPAACATNSVGFATTADTTQYYLSFNLDTALPSGNVLNNHIPVDPIMGGALTVTKTASIDTVNKGDLVPYVIRVHNNLTINLNAVDVVDQMPPGFKYVEDSAQLDQVLLEPNQVGRELHWPNIDFSVDQTHVFTLLMIPGSGVADGEYTNRAWAEMFGNLSSNIASAVVQVVPNPTFDCSDIIGKVFDDHNLNGYQDSGEPGLPAVRLATVSGELITTDSEGRYHVTCAATPDEMRGTNFILKLDARTLPSGYRVTTENPRVIRLTTGKIAKLNFGAGIHRIVRLDLTSEAFVENETELAETYLQRLNDLLVMLQKAPSILRIAYQLENNEEEGRAQERVDYVDKFMRERWSELGDCCYDLQLEKEIIEAGDGGGAAVIETTVSEASASKESTQEVAQ